MNLDNAIDIAQTDTEISFSLVFDAPRELVFQTFSEAEHLQKWWGPKFCPVSNITVDFKVGGEWRYSLQIPDGEERWAKAIYDEIVPNERIVFTDYLITPKGDVIKDFPSKKVTVTFDDTGGKTHMNVHVQLTSVMERQKLVDLGFMPGFQDALGNLRELLDQIKSKE
ncbi:MAG: hypothetical protein JWO07_192 [Candidatus Saccharibacteria bacterium]|nr:hypothetical protein [Candidatus Saccharibacteria bacterium]